MAKMMQITNRLNQMIYVDYPLEHCSIYNCQLFSTKLAYESTLQGLGDLASVFFSPSEKFKES